MIFVQPELKADNKETLTFTGADERAACAKELFETLNFKTEICRNFSKEQVKETLEQLEQKAIVFEEQRKQRKDNTVCALAIVWVGFKLVNGYQEQNDIIKQKLDFKEKKTSDGTWC